MTRQPDHYKSRTKTQAQLAKSIASLPPPPAANKKVMSEAMATKFQSADFWTSLDQFAQDPTFGLGLSASDAEEFKKLFKKEHRNKVKGLKTEEMEVRAPMLML